MNSEKFYELVDTELQKILHEFRGNEVLKKNEKPFAFLIWFLKRYLPHKDASEYKDYITEGSHDNSCDLIFDNTDQSGMSTYYIVQAKWYAKSNIKSENEMGKGIRYCLSEITDILSGQTVKHKDNIVFQNRYEALMRHKRMNGQIKVLFVALCQGIANVREVSQNFVSNLRSFEVYDINKLKEDYIEAEYKKISTHNPIETPYISKSEFTLSIVKGRFIEAPDNLPYKAYMLLVKPSEVFSLFNKYGFSLFYQNIRNPLPNSFFNKEISQTLKDNPLQFWYYNNGITAITENILPFYRDNDQITLKGIQIINGAQTVYTVYEAYKLADDTERSIMDENALISLRIVKSGGKDFDFNITKFTNSQNPIKERDFHANDEHQKRIQKAFYTDTNIWYETRRGEYRQRIMGVRIVSNEDLAQTYLAYQLQDPFNAKQNKKSIFRTSTTYGEKGLYEKIFNSGTDYKKMYISFYIYMYIEQKRKFFKKETIRLEKNASPDQTQNQHILNMGFVQYASYDILALFKVVFDDVNRLVLREAEGKLFTAIKKEDYKSINQYYEFIIESLTALLKKEKEINNQLVHSVWFKHKESYNKMRRFIEDKLDSTAQGLEVFK